MTKRVDLACTVSAEELPVTIDGSTTRHSSVSCLARGCRAVIDLVARGRDRAQWRAIPTAPGAMTRERAGLSRSPARLVLHRQALRWRSTALARRLIELDESAVWKRR